MTLKDKIKNHFSSKQWDFKFDWGAGKERWGMKYETVKSLSRLFDCPKTSLYVPIHELAKENFLTFSRGLVSLEEKLHSEQNVQECDARDDAQRDEAGNQNKTIEK